MLVCYHDLEQLVQSSLSGPVHCRQVTSHRWQLPCGLRYSPADGEQHKSPLQPSLATISNETPVLRGRTSHFCCSTEKKLLASKPAGKVSVTLFVFFCLEVLSPLIHFDSAVCLLTWVFIISATWASETRRGVPAAREVSGPSLLIYSGQLFTPLCILRC